MRFPFPEHPSSEPGANPCLAVQTLVTAEQATDACAVEEIIGEINQPESLPPGLAPDTAEPGPASASGVAEGEPATADNIEPRPQPIPAVRPRARRKVIAFPRPAVELMPTRHRLADPVVPEEPRILDVPEELEALPTTPFLEGLQFGPGPMATPSTRTDDQIDLPYHAARIEQRVHAAAIDGALVAAGIGLFAAIGYKMLPKLVLSKPLVLGTGAVAVLLWAAYQYLLLVYGGSTLGMRMAGIRLSTFRGNTPRFRERRNRVIGLYFSIASLAMGLLWAFVDVDTLCWHDRISGTYLTNKART